MKIITKFKENLVHHFKILSLWGINHYLTRTHQLKIVLATILNFANSVAKILAPAALAKAIEMFALSEDSAEIGPFELKGKDLLYISLILTAWIKSEIHLKNFLIKGIEGVITEKNAKQIIEMIHKIPLDQHIKIREEITKSLIDIVSLQSKFGTEVVTIIYQVLIDIMMGTVMIWHRYGNLLGAEFLIYSILDIILLSHLIEYFTTQSNYFNKANNTLHKFINHEYGILTSEETVRMFNHEQLEIDISESFLHKYLAASQRYHHMENITTALNLIPILLANIIPISFIMKDGVSIEDLDDFVFLLSYVNLFGSNITSLKHSIKTCLRAVKSIEDMNQLLAKSRSYFNTTQQDVVVDIDRTILNVDYPPPEISFENVHFSYPNSHHPTLKGLTFKIQPGSRVGFIGGSGAGKSTIVKLLYRFYKPQIGTILLNGNDIQSIPRSVLSRIFCIVPQNVDLFRDRSIKYNVLYGSINDLVLKKYLHKKSNENGVVKKKMDYHSINSLPSDIENNNFSSTYQKMEKMFSQTMEQVQLQDLDKKSLDKKYSTLTLSGGQRQRVSIARAIVRDPRILILDEGTGSLDATTERQVMRNILEITKGKTTLMITHRLSTIKDADEIIVLENGVIKEKGSPSLLMENQADFYNYWQAQK